MSRGPLRRQLRRRPLLLLLFGAALAFFFFGPLGLAPFVGTLAGGAGGDTRWVVPWLFLVLAGVSLVIAGCSARALLRWDRHPDIIALARYGPPAEVLSAIDAELRDGLGVVRVGRVLKSFTPVPLPASAELGGAEVILTEPWLVHLWGEDGHRVNVMRLDDLVCAARQRFIVRGGIEAALLLIDRHDARLEVFGTEAGVSRLMAEVLVRVPWALDRFDAEAERTWQQDRTGILAELDRRREQLRRADAPSDGPQLQR